MTDFTWQDEQIAALEPLAPLLSIDSDDAARTARAALAELPTPHNAEQAVVLGTLRQLISQALERWQAAPESPAEGAAAQEPADHALAFLQVLMQQHQLKAVDLRELIGSKTLLSLIFSGQRRLTRDHITRLSQYFRVSPALFFPPLPLAAVSVKAPEQPTNLSAAGLWLELRMYLDTHLLDRKNGSKTRNMDLVCDYFGFSVSPWEDLQTLADKYKFNSRERSRQIMQMAFRDFADAGDLPLARQAASLLEIAGAITMQDFTRVLAGHGLLDQPVQARGLLIYLRELGLCQDFGVYVKDMVPLRKSMASDDPPIWLIDKQWLHKHRQMLHDLYTLPGLIGLACLDDFFVTHELDDTQQNLAWLMLENMSDFWSVQEAGETWFAIEGRTNRVINDLGKIFAVLEQCKPARLAHCIHNGLSNRTRKQRRPSPELIEEFLKTSMHTEFDGRFIRFNGELAELNPIEQDTVAWLRKRNYTGYPELKEHLLGLGYSKPNTDKAITKSPLVYVDKSRGRSHYRYSWVGG